jgi:hypothetical protein
MDLSIYVGKMVYVTLNNSYTYKGKVLDAGKDFLTLMDVKGQRVTITPESISFIREVKG